MGTIMGHGIAEKEKKAFRGEGSSPIPSNASSIFLAFGPFLRPFPSYVDPMPLPLCHLPPLPHPFGPNAANATNTTDAGGEA